MKHKLKKVLLLGSGGLKIGQAGEFDYSGSQAIKALKEEKIEVVLMNPNIATVQTDQGLADTVYFLPLTEHFATQVIKKEKPDAILLSFGGQTALNLGLALEKSGTLRKFGVRVLGTPVSVIRDTEDRDLFVKRLHEIEVKTARSRAAKNTKEALAAAADIGYPVMMRAGFALGGEGSGMVKNTEELSAKLSEVFRSTPQVLIEENLSGWKEVEYEVVRDRADNCITVCNMENIDPMGIHTGESMVVAPSQTLSNEEYHRLREISIRTIRHLGIVGECNIQYALHPETADYRVIEVNARLSRSSALASKATGYPLAFVAAKLALGYTLPEIKNSVTGITTACFEPALDYLVLKMPRWDLGKFENAAQRIGTEMKSVGEVMAIGRSFEEVLQKALRMLNVGASGFSLPATMMDLRGPSCEKEVRIPTTRRIFAIAAAFRRRTSVEKIHKLSGIDRWFLEKMRNIVEFERHISKNRLNKQTMQAAKKLGFSDAQIAVIKKINEESVRALRKKLRILPVVKQIDTLAGEFPAQTNYLYLTYHGTEHDVIPGKKQVAVLGSGPYCIGSSVEFDWSCVQALKTLKACGKRTIMINSNPETVSTDYDMSDRLYFEELTLERILDIVEFEKPEGVVVSTGGQIPNNLALKLHKNKIKILGTNPEDIDRAEDRHVFSKLLDTLGVEQPAWTEVTSPSQAAAVAETIGYPVLVRPSYVLSGAAMKVAYDRKTLQNFLDRAAIMSPEHPVVISKFIENAREIEIDGVASRGTLAIYAITEHVENAGTHSGDATVVLPPQRTYLETIRRAKEITKAIIKALKITGPFNMQFIAKDNRLQVIECNVRASRSFPFVSKVTGHNFIDIATRAMLGKDVSGNYRTVELDCVAVKSPQFSYSRIKGADPRTGVEMASTGEVACFGDSYSEALLKSMMAAGFRLPRKNILVSIGGEESKVKLLETMKLLSNTKFKLFATEHTAEYLHESGLPCEKLYKISSKKAPNVSEALGRMDLIINIPTRAFAGETTDGSIIRRKAVDMNIPLITNRQLAEAFVTALAEQKGNGLKAKSWEEYRS
ncbi:carbamoyl phosphate synthase large subunit [Candidatus Kaiserbacteria bacterium RIFCSPHIGHO2_01_FULL_54_36]|uniref:Carbamoyl phosphate synthase large subunit n=1 Tax=Candidatus Kaiserbacteria bacterium RIFCSPHIGHO2_01_FULL_54_36 TaxID=1798482 RepID=A0A1F6CNX7_9BACT|nr:MAG: carbamoyl phosphate synthase large subunit [Candidatus Kaiserbacteria bacterium RIFCSPHIGHO2_01_FULL_54_36]OGG75500.1 MAG: carbamoyl phosphate synthase large subunit [Candidatus Kaiserbacteria bacterium RIFCSPLOWO2_01_FULL_54_22]